MNMKGMTGTTTTRKMNKKTDSTSWSTSGACSKKVAKQRFRLKAPKLP